MSANATDDDAGLPPRAEGDGEDEDEDDLVCAVSLRCRCAGRVLCAGLKRSLKAAAHTDAIIVAADQHTIEAHQVRHKRETKNERSWTS